MKNIHILPTDKPSRLIGSRVNLSLKEIPILGFDAFKTQHIYITNDEEIKEGEYCITKTNEVIKFKKSYTQGFLYKKIILTTDQDLIKFTAENDDVQAIPDEFLEWFVKNPSCEYVEVEESTLLNTSRTYLGVDKYKIIIPKEEPKNIYKGVLNNITFGENEMYYVNIPELGNIPVNYQVEINLGEKYLQTLLGKPLNWRVTEFDYTHKRPEGRYRVIGLE